MPEAHDRKNTANGRNRKNGIGIKSLLQGFQSNTAQPIAAFRDQPCFGHIQKDLSPQPAGCKFSGNSLPVHQSTG